ncbi:MAG: hypothetical protein ABIK65_12630 [Candidatus Eisenbacteria bacterium]
MKIALGFVLLLFFLLLTVVLYWWSLVRIADSRFDEAMKTAAGVRSAGASIGEAEEGIVPVSIEGADGERGEGLIRFPADGTEAGVGVLLIGGIGTGANAARLAPPRSGMVVLALEYPLKAKLPRGSILAKVGGLGAIVEGVGESLVAFALGRRFLEECLGAEKIVVVGVSLGVPFAAALASMSEKPDAAALLYGGGDVGPVIARALPGRPDFLKAIVGRMLGRVVARFDPVRLVPEIAPCPLLLVNAERDPRIPAESVRVLHEVAREPKKIVLLEGGHVLPEKEELLRTLVGEVFLWLEELELLQEDTGTQPGGPSKTPE